MSASRAVILSRSFGTAKIPPQVPGTACDFLNLIANLGVDDHMLQK
jgi:hypothetical protein